VPILGNDPRKREKPPDLIQKRKLLSEIVREALYPDFIPKLILFLNRLEKGSIQERPARAHGWDSVRTWMEDDEMRRRVIGYLLSAASVYLAMGYMVSLFLSLMNSFSLPAL